MRPGRLAIFCALCLGQAVLRGQIQFHVATDGDDAHAGTADAPFKTVQRARDALRQQPHTHGAEVVIHAGTYTFLDPLIFTEHDSGAAETPVVYRAADGDRVWFTGGVALARDALKPVTDPALLRRLKPETRRQARQVVLSPELRARLAPAWPDTWWMYRREVTALNELFAGDTRLPMARWPNDGYATFGDILEPAEKEGETPVFAFSDERPESWQTAVDNGLWLYGYWRRGYRAEFIRVKAIDTATRQIQLAARNSLGNLDTGGAGRYCAVNLPEELDAPGEWVLNRETGALVLWPPEVPPAAQLVLSLNPDAVIVCNDTAGIEFRNLGVECAAGSGIRIQNGDDCRIVACEIRNVGVHGIAAHGNRTEIRGCDIHHTGDKAVVLNSGDRSTLTAGKSVVDNCHIHHTNRIVRAGSQAVSIDGVGNRFAHNLIHDTGYIAVRFAGNDHVLEHNRLFRTNVESAEGGVFYTGRDWTSRGSVIRYNLLHHIEDTQEGCGSSTRFVHLDDSAPEIEIYGNVCYRMGGGVSICGGAANNVHDNLFVECAWGVDIGPRGQDMFEPDGKGGFVMTGQRGWSSLAKRLNRINWKQPPYSTRYPKLVEIFTKRPIAAPWFNIVNRNVMVDCGRGIRESNMQPGWSTVESNWEGEDPGFVQPDRTKLDFRLADDARVYREIGFRPLELDDVGLYASADRRSWPVPLDLPSPDWKPRWMRLREEAKKSPNDLPVFRVMKVTGKIVVDGVVDPMEWTPGDATGTNPEIHDTAELVWTHAGNKALRPSQAMLQTDETSLYVSFRNEVDPNAGTTDGHTWGRDDAVEIALADVRDESVGPIMVLRGYADGAWESSGEAGAPADVVKRAGTGVAYAAEPAGKGMWCAEWRIPFTALGIEPKKRNPRLIFNLSVRKPAGDEWVMWNRNGGATWEVHRSGFLWLAQFGDMAPAQARFPSEARVDIDSRANPVTMLPQAGCKIAEWANPSGCYLSAMRQNLSTDAWSDMVFSFIPQTDGTVILKLMGAGHRVPGSDRFIPVWVYSDDLRVEGAELVNGSFEAPGTAGVPDGWRTDVSPGLWIQDPDLAAQGEWCVKTAHNHRFAQQIAVYKNTPVTIRLKVRAVNQ